MIREAASVPPAILQSAIPPVLEIRNVAKRFDATQALEDVSLALYAGQIHALLGENGAGKSTLIKIITGVHQPDRGQLLLAGRPVAVASAAEAQRLGIAAIYQEPLLFPDLNVAENIFISHQGRAPSSAGGTCSARPSPFSPSSASRSTCAIPRAGSRWRRNNRWKSQKRSP